MMEPCGSTSVHPAHHYVAADSNGYLCEGIVDPDAVMAAHAEHIELNGRCEQGWPKWRVFASNQNCEPYRLAKALAAVQRSPLTVDQAYADLERAESNLASLLADQSEQAS